MFNPFLDNIETLGRVKNKTGKEAPKIEGRPMSDMEEWEIKEWLSEPFLTEEEKEGLMILDLQRKERVNHNRKRAYQMNRGVKQNQLAYRRLEKYLEETHRDRIFTDEEAIVVSSYRRAINTCCHHSLFREHDGGTLEFIAANTCKHKYCNVCNARRCKEIRKRYRQLFEKDPTLLENYDFMHLTLTVPHTEAGWLGKQWYAEELMKKFNLMRKRSWWKSTVYAGEFGVEATKNENGLHIHIHSLVLVRKIPGSRNFLHRNILMEWNKLTAWEGTARLEIEATAREKILKSNKTLTETDIAFLNPKGATMIGLESVYLKAETQQKGYVWNEATGAYIKRVNYKRDGVEPFMNAIMECIKYHFEPSGMQGDGTADLDLMLEILPAIKGKPLYRKFGAFHCGTKDSHPLASMLNYNSDLSDPDEMDKDLELNANEYVMHPDTGNPVERESYRYFIVALAKVWFDATDDHKPHISGFTKRDYLPETASMRQALEEMTYRSVDKNMRLKKEYDKMAA